jgi:hypothetical protein
MLPDDDCAAMNGFAIDAAWGRAYDADADAVADADADAGLGAPTGARCHEKRPSFKAPPA